MYFRFMLRSRFRGYDCVAGIDEAGRGSLAGPVYAAAVILPAGYRHPLLDDSKKMRPADRETVRADIESRALAWAVGQCDHREIDRYNILKATLRAMHRALDGLEVRPGLILVDGNRFEAYGDIPFKCVIGGDASLAPVAAASVLAKTHRDAHMRRLHDRYPMYGWNRNMAYGTPQHRAAVKTHGPSPFHRKTFTIR
jgi:ribonuclease HII